MVKPQILLDQMRRHWSFVRAVAELTEDNACFEHDQLLRLAALELPQLSSDERRSALGRMVDVGLLQVGIGSEGYELHPAALEFARFILNEHALGPVGVIQVYVEAMAKATDQLRQGVAHGSFDREVKEANAALLTLARQIRSRVEADYQAILGVIDKAKSTDADLPLSTRYDMVLRAYEDYLTPMKGIISIDGDFNRYLWSAQESLDDAADAARRANAAPGLDRKLTDSALFMRRLPARVRDLMGRAGQMLRPLVDQARRHSEMARCVGLILGEVRRRGATQSLPPAALPGFMRTRQYTIRLGLGLDAMVARVSDTNTTPKPFPDLAPRSTPAEVVALIPLHRVAAELKDEDQGVPDLLTWLHNHYPQLGPKTTLGLYLDLLRTSPFPVPTGERRSLEIGGMRLTYTPHGTSPPKERA